VLEGLKEAKAARSAFEAAADDAEILVGGSARKTPASTSDKAVVSSVCTYAAYAPERADIVALIEEQEGRRPGVRDPYKKRA
jgi:hypothetical protein